MNRNIPRYLLTIVALLLFVITSSVTMNNRTSAASGEQALRTKPATFRQSAHVTTGGGNGVNKTRWGNLVRPVGIIRSGARSCEFSCAMDLSVFFDPCTVLPITITVDVRCGNFRECGFPYSFTVIGPGGNIVYSNSNPNGQGVEQFQATIFGIYDILVTNSLGCQSGCHVPVLPCCSLTQDEWGNNNSTIRGERVLEILEGLYLLEGGQVYAGVQGLRDVPGRSLRFPRGSEACIIQRLPGSRNVGTLPKGLGDAIIDPSSCQSSPPVPIDLNGKFENVLLGQQIALSLSILYSKPGDTPMSFGLGDVHLCLTMVTKSPGPDGILGTTDDSIKIVSIPRSVIKALSKLGLDSTVDGLVELADLALGGRRDLGASLKEISDAEDAINSAFDGCAFLISSFRFNCTDK